MEFKIPIDFLLVMLAICSPFLFSVLLFFGNEIGKYFNKSIKKNR